MSDVQIRSALERGFEFEVPILGGVVQLEPGLSTAVVLSLFGGNLRDNATAATQLEQYWGNLLETEESRKLRSRTQYLLTTLPPIPASVAQIDEAVLADLAWMIEAGAASETTSRTTIPALNRVQLDVRIVAEGVESRFVFAGNWRASV